MNRFQHRYDISNEKLLGPWPCEGCGQLSQYAVATPSENHVFCKNENCRFERLIDKRHSRVVENDGTVWAFDNSGNKWRVRA